MDVLDVNVILKNNYKIEKDVYYKDYNTRNYLPYVSPHPDSCKNIVLCTIAERIIVFVSDDKKIDLRLKELRNWLKNNKCPDHIIAKNVHDAKLQGPARKVKDLVTYHLKPIFSKNLKAP